MLSCDPIYEHLRHRYSRYVYTDKNCKFVSNVLFFFLFVLWVVFEIVQKIENGIFVLTFKRLCKKANSWIELKCKGTHSAWATDARFAQLRFLLLKSCCGNFLDNTSRDAPRFYWKVPEEQRRLGCPGSNPVLPAAIHIISRASSWRSRVRRCSLDYVPLSRTWRHVMLCCYVTRPEVTSCGHVTSSDIMASRGTVLSRCTVTSWCTSRDLMSRHVVASSHVLPWRRLAPWGYAKQWRHLTL